MRGVRPYFYLLLFLIGATALGVRYLAPGLLPDARAQAGPGAFGVILEVKGPIGPAVADYLVREIERAGEDGAEIIIAEMDTPGGLDASMRQMIQAILASDVPVATYVAPSGARAASAGLYILYASHIAAMAPGTNAGAATPVQIGGTPSQPEPEGVDEGVRDATDQDSDRSAGGALEQAEETEESRDAADNPALGNDDALRAKAINDAVAYIRALAEQRGRNADWAERAVREAVSASASEALELGAIDVVADDIDDLLAAIDGRVVRLQLGEKTLATEGLRLERRAPDWLTRFLAIITDPNIAFILLNIGVTGIIIELWNPGSILPGAVGVLSLLTGLYALSVLPVNYYGGAMMAAGAIMILAEAFATSYGILGAAGLALFGFGAWILFPSDAPGFAISRPLILTTVAIAGTFLALVLFFVARSFGRVAVIGEEAIRGRTGYVDDWEGLEGHVVVEGERWKAKASKPLQKGQKIKVVAIDGLVLTVREVK